MCSSDLIDMELDLLQAQKDIGNLFIERETLKAEHNKVLDDIINIIRNYDDTCGHRLCEIVGYINKL